MTRLRSLIKEVLSTPPKKKDCNCGCGGCDKKSPIITEGRIKKAISEGLTYHVENKIPLHESVYRIGSEKHFELINEARKLWVRGLIDVSEDDQAILETHLGNFGMYEGEKVPLDMPMVNEEKKLTYADFVQMVRDDMKAGAAGDEYASEKQIERVARYKYDDYQKGVSVDDLFEESLDEGFKDYLGYSDHTRSDSGLNVIPKDQIHANKLKDAIEDSGMYAEWNTREGYFFFPEEEDGYDQLEMEIQNLMDENNIQGYIEGVFEESLNEVEIGDRVEIDKNYGGGRGIVDDKVGGYVIINGKSYHESDVKVINSVNEANLDDELKSKRKKIELEYGPRTYKALQIALMKGEDGKVAKILDTLNEAEFQGKDVELNKPKRGGSKAYYVYVRDPKTKKIKKVSFGSGGLRAKIKNKEARNAFAARHNCKNKKDRTTAGYWSCNLPRYADQLGLGANMNTFW